MPRTNTKTRTGPTRYEKTSPTWKEYGRRWDRIEHEKVWNTTHKEPCWLENAYTVEKCKEENEVTNKIRGFLE